MIVPEFSDAIHRMYRRRREVRRLFLRRDHFFRALVAALEISSKVAVHPDDLKLIDRSIQPKEKVIGTLWSVSVVFYPNKFVPRGHAYPVPERPVYGHDLAVFSRELRA